MADVEKNADTGMSGLQAGVEKNADTDAGGDPPSYDSTFVRLKSVREQSSGPGNCIAKFAMILCGSVFGTIAIGLVLAIPLAMIIVGALHQDDCPAERFIPIYLIVGGTFGVLQSVMTTFLRVRNQQNQTDDDNACPNPVSGIVVCFLLAWFITGSVWVYRIYGDVQTTNPGLGNYCHGGTYWFAFVLITAGYVSMALSLCCCLTAVAAAFCFS